MPKLSVEELQRKLTTDESGKLLWDGKEVRVGGLTRQEFISIVAIVIAAVAATTGIVTAMRPATSPPVETTRAS